MTADTGVYVHLFLDLMTILQSIEIIIFLGYGRVPETMLIIFNSLDATLLLMYAGAMNITALGVK